MNIQLDFYFNGHQFEVVESPTRTGLFLKKRPQRLIGSRYMDKDELAQELRRLANLLTKAATVIDASRNQQITDTF